MNHTLFSKEFREDIHEEIGSRHARDEEGRWIDEGRRVKQGWRNHSQCFRNSKVGGRGFPGGAVVKNPSPNAGDTGSSPGPGRSHMPRSN